MIKEKKHNKILIGLVAIALAVVCVLLPFIGSNKNRVFADNGTFAPTFGNSFYCTHWSSDSSITTNAYTISIVPYILANDTLTTIGFVDAKMIRSVNGSISVGNLNLYKNNTLLTPMAIDYYNSWIWQSITGSVKQQIVIGDYRFNNEPGGNNYVGFNFTVLFERTPYDSDGANYVYYDSWSPSSVRHVTLISYVNGVGNSNYIDLSYTDINNVSLVFRFKLAGYNSATYTTLVNWFGSGKTTQLDYYTQTNAIYTSAEQLQDAYNRGYDYGYSIGNGANMNETYTEGYNSGYNTGYSVGYNDGLEEETYTFVNVIGAVIDAPIAGITGLLNFELFGVNLSGFFYGLITVALVLVIIRFIKGGR